MRVLVTGATGFVGRSLCSELFWRGHSVRAVCRRFDHMRALPAGIDAAVTGAIDTETDWSEALAGYEAVIHLAARVHVLEHAAADHLGEFRRVNTEATLNLARQAAAVGVKRFVFLSTIKVNGEGFPLPQHLPHMRGGVGYSEADEPAPQDAYAISKWEAEQGLMTIAQEIGMEVVILRPPLVYGPGVGANFLRLLRLVDRGMPLPFGAVENRRSLIYMGNLVDAISVCLTHPAAANQTYLASDGEDVSTPDLIRRLAALMDRPARLWPVPLWLLGLAGRVVGKGAEVQRLVGSLSLDSGRIRRELGWHPPFSLDEGLSETVRWYQGR